MPPSASEVAPASVPRPSRGGLPALAAASASAAAQAARFALPLRGLRWRGGPGEHAGADTGGSLDFQDHRAYAPGDDPRHINWQAYARTGQYSLKLYRAEVRPVAEIVFDVSGSMFAGEAKAARSLELLYLATAAAERAGAALSVHLVKGPSRLLVDAAAVRSHRWAEFAAGLPPTESAAAPRPGGARLRPGSLRLFISDLLYPAPPGGILADLLAGGGRAVILCPTSAAESRPDWEGDLHFVDTESGERRHHRIDSALRERYLAAYRRHFEAWKDEAVRRRVPIARVPAEAPTLAEALLAEALPCGALEPAL